MAPARRRPRWAGWPGGRWPTASRPPPIEYAERAAALARDGLPLADQLVHARALLQLGRADEALAYAEKIAANAGDEPVCRAEALLVAGRAHEALGDSARAVAAWQEALDVATDAELPAGAGRTRCAGSAWPTSCAGRLAEASSRFAAAYQVDARRRRPARAGLVAAEPGLGDHHPGRLRRRRRGAGPGGPALRRARRPGRPGLAARHDGVRPAAGRPARRGAAAGPGRSCRSASGSARRWAVGTLRAVEAFAAAELGDLAEADREARRAYRDFAAVVRRLGARASRWSSAAWSRAGWASRSTPTDLLTDALAYAERTGHPLLHRHGRHACAASSRCDRGDVDAAEADARAVLTAVEPHNPLAPAQVGPRVLLAEARLRAGDPATAVGLLAPIAQPTPARRRCCSPAGRRSPAYASALLADGRVRRRRSTGPGGP